MSASSDSACSTHSVYEFLLVVAGFFARKLDLDIYGATVRATMPPYIGFAMLTDIHDSAVLRKELPYRMVTSYASVLA